MAVVKGYREFVPYEEGKAPGNGVIKFDVEKGSDWSSDAKTWDSFESEDKYLQYMNSIDPIKTSRKRTKKSTDNDEQVTDEPVTDEPVTDEPVTDEPVTDTQ